MRVLFEERPLRTCGGDRVCVTNNKGMSKIKEKCRVPMRDKKK